METVRFVGRRAILGEIGAALAAARAGHGGLVLLTGPAGAGKTATAEEVARRAEGFRVFWGWCQPGGAYLPWARVLREVAGADERCGRIVAESAPLRALLAGRVSAGETAGRAGRTSQTGQTGKAGPTDAASATGAPRDPGAARLRLTGDIAELLRAVGRAGPVLLVLDDVHDADASSLRLLEDLTSTVRTGPVVILATARDSEADWPGRQERRAALLRAGRGLRLGPLSEDDVGALLAAADGGRPADPGEVGALLKRTGGDAFFVVESLRQRVIGDAGSGRVPMSVRDAVLARTALLPEADRAVLGVAAALGTRFHLDVLAAAADVPLSRAGEALAAAESAGLAAPEGPGLGRFRHDLMREAVYDAIPDAERPELHARIAATLAELARRGRDVGPAEVADHLARAGSDGEAAAEYAWRAGDHAAGLLAFDDAVRWYEAARWDGRAAGDRARLAVATGSARLGAGDRAGARGDFLRAAAAAREAGDRALLAEAALGLGAGSAGFEVDLFDREQIDLLEEARAGLAVDPDPKDNLLALVTARLSVATSLMEDVGRRTALAEEAVAVARASGDPGAVAYALSALCDAKSGPDDRDARQRWAEEMITCARQAHDVPLELLGRRFRLVALLEAGDAAGAEDEAVAFDAAARLLRQPLYAWYVPLWRGMRALMQGRFADCEAALGETDDLARRSGSPNAAMLADTQRWFLLSDRLPDGREALVRFLDGMPRLDALPGVWPKVTLALAAAQRGDLDEARTRLTAVAPRLAGAPRDSEWLPMLAQAAEAVAAVGGHPVGATVSTLLAPYADLFVVEGIGAVLRGPVRYYLGLLAAADGDGARAREYFAAAERLAEQAGMAALVERIRRAAGERGPEPPPPAAAPHEIRREGEFWVLRYRGREVRVRDSKGLHDLAVLLTRPGTPVPALDLATASTASTAVPDRSAGLHSPGDLGDLVDARARDAYRRRLRQLAVEAEDADAAGDAARSARVAAEHDALVAQLSAAYGLGGRPRRTGSAAERARSSVTSRLRAATDRIGRDPRHLGRHLAVSVRTGTLCVYEPESEQTWLTS
ncbi:ATP-binding protein [Catenulispora subtropica]|uniref:AAA+ ATPase domain-containing protein n=1 Tax=Catenulispora subtropica TaxID=450798 RepID=A0ABN2SAE2_9ACTN